MRSVTTAIIRMKTARFRRSDWFVRAEIMLPTRRAPDISHAVKKGE